MSHLICRVFQRIPCILARTPCLRLMRQSTACCSTSSRGLLDFFEPEENWGEANIAAGRPWRTDELRIKSNTDIHKLWYVLLKERNLIMTMEAEYKHASELFPNPERLEKVEESMENILEVVAERNRAYNLLETGETGETKRRWAINPLGQCYWRTENEHYIPWFMNTSFKSRTALTGPWQNKYLRLWREKTLKLSSKKRTKAIRQTNKLKTVFPDAEID